ncbi:MAG: cytochrome c-type biogenesis protein CcmH, partial [Candidatus Paceibacteria bacterium]
MIFWLIASALTLLVAVILIRPMLLGDNAPRQSDENLDLQVYRDQLAEVDSDLAKHVLSEDEAARTRLEVSRRILDADAAQSETKANSPASKPTNMAAALLTGLVLLAGTGTVYWQIGAKGAPDLPRAKRVAQIAKAQAVRPPQTEAEANVGAFSEIEDQAEQAYKNQVADLRRAVAGRPNDLTGHELLANHEARLGRFAAARIAKGKAIALKGGENTARDYTDWAELMI